MPPVDTTEVNETENPVTETPESDVTTPSEDDPEVGATTDEVVEEDAGGEEQPPAYTPNFKFKFAVAGKPTAEEKEFDEVLKPLIKDAETEKKFRDLYEKAYGLDFVKPRYQQTRQELQTTKEELTGLTTELQHVGKALEREDYGVLLEKFGVPEEKLLRWAANRVRYLTEMSQEERQRVDRELERERKLTQGDDEVSRLRAENLENAATIMHMRLEQELVQPNVAAIVQAVDAKRGQGAFKTEVIRIAAEMSEFSGRDVPASIAVREAVKMWAPFAQAQSQAPKQENPTGEKAQKGKPPVIPHIKGAGTSPAKKVISSLDELKKLHNRAVAYQADEE